MPSCCPPTASGGTSTTAREHARIQLPRLAPQGRADLLNIENNLAADRTPWDTVCYHAQQAAEKTLKAFLVYHHRPPPRTHDLVALLARCAALTPALARLEADCRDLTAFAVGSRYPDDLFEPTKDDARAMTAAARRVRAPIVALLP